MQVLLNQRRVTELEPGAATVGEVLEALEVYLAPGDVLTEVLLDGERFSAGEPALYERRSAGGLGQLGLETSSPADLAAGLRDQVAAALVVVVAKLERVVDRLADGAWAPANELLAELLEELRLTLVLDRQIAELDPALAPLEMDRLEQAGRELLGAQEAGGASVLGERLRSTFLPLLRGWLEERMGPEPESPSAPRIGASGGGGRLSGRGRELLDRLRAADGSSRSR